MVTHMGTGVSTSSGWLTAPLHMSLQYDKQYVKQQPNSACWANWKKGKLLLGRPCPQRWPKVFVTWTLDLFVVANFLVKLCQQLSCICLYCTWPASVLGGQTLCKQTFSCSAQNTLQLLFLEVKHSANIYMYSTDHYNLLQYNINSVIMQQLPWLPFFFLLVPTFLGRILQTMFLLPIIIQNCRRCPRRMAVFNSFLKIINDWLCTSHPILTFDLSTWKHWCQLHAHWRIFPLNVQFLWPSTLDWYLPVMNKAPLILHWFERSTGL